MKTIEHSSDLLYNKYISDKKTNIVGVGFDAQNKSCFKKHLLNQLSLYLPSMQVLNEIPKEARVLIINLDADTTSILKKQLPADDTFVILIVHEITRVMLPFMKLADHVIFINEVQQSICEDFLEFDYPSTVLPYPYGEGIVTNQINNDCFIYFEGDKFLLDESYYNEQIQTVLKWHVYNAAIANYHILFEVSPSETERFENFKSRLQASHQTFQLYNAKELSIQDIFDLVSRSFCAQVIKKELTLEQYLEALENRQSAILHDSLSESSILPILTQIGCITSPCLNKSFYNFNLNNLSTWNNWHTSITAILNEHFQSSLITKQKSRDAIAIDRLEDLNIIWGKPLSNEYVFSICFQNQEHKIIRCLQSIIEQEGNHDIGIAVISDQSSDRSIDLILNFIRDKKIDVCVVDNQTRKLASRNFYNIAHLLTTNLDSIIMELDGDDFLAGSHVVTTLKGYYANGALKTNGSFRMDPEEQTYTTQAELDFNHQNYDISDPWSVKCTSWLHLRTVKRHILCNVELEYFLERKSKQWLNNSHDTAIQPRLIELSEGKSVFVKEILYCYDVSGENHDHAEHSRDEKIIGSYKKMDKLYHPIYYS